MPLHGKITPDQWMAIAGALRNVGGMFGPPGRQGQGYPMMLQAIEQQSARRKEEAFRDLLKGFATPTARGPQYAGPPPAGPTNLVPPSSGGRVPVGSQLPGPAPQMQPGTPSQVSPGALQPGIDPRLLSLIGAIGQEKGLPLLIQQMAKGPQEHFKVVRDPYGRGGVGQRSTLSGQISGYQKAADKFGPVEYDEKLKRYYQVASNGRRHYIKPGEGGLTAAQLANNREIDQARSRLEQLEQGLSPGATLGDELHRRMSTRNPATGALTPDFNSFWGKLGWLAMQSKPGGDPDHERWSRLMMMPPQFSEPAGAKQFPKGYTAPEAPGLLDRGLDFLGLGGEPPQGQAPASKTPRPMRGRLSRGRLSARTPVEQMSVTEIDDLINQRGDTLSPAELRAVQTRLKALGL